MGLLKQPRFRGHSFHRLDSKGRLRIPTKFREILQQNYTDGLILTNMPNCLVAYPPEVWEEIESKAVTMSQVQPQQRSFVRYFIASAVECEFDRQGRILIPPLLRARAEIDQEVLLIGAMQSIEIWSRESYEREMERSKQNFDQMAQDASVIGV